MTWGQQHSKQNGSDFNYNNLIIPASYLGLADTWWTLLLQISIRKQTPHEGLKKLSLSTSAENWIRISEDTIENHQGTIVPRKSPINKS